jgi:hypothetical protein
LALRAPFVTNVALLRMVVNFINAIAEAFIGYGHAHHRRSGAPPP